MCVHACSVLLLQCSYPKDCTPSTGLCRDLNARSPQRSSPVSGLCQRLSQALGEAGQTAAGTVLAVHSSASSGWEAKLRPPCGCEQGQVLLRWLQSRVSLCSGILMCVIRCVCGTYIPRGPWGHISPAPALLGEERGNTVSCRRPSVFTAATRTCHRSKHTCVVLDLQFARGPGHEQSANPL